MLAAVGLLAGVLAGCAPTIGVPAGPHATVPVCAKVILATPDTLVDQPRARTTSQATTAWGAAGSAITLTCGASQPPPSTDCVSLNNGLGGEDDWIAAKTTTGWRFTTYGRAPAIQLELPDVLGLTQPTAPLADLSGAVDLLEVTAHCT